MTRSLGTSAFPPQQRDEERPRILVTSGTLAGHRDLLARLEGRYSLDYRVQEMPEELAPYHALVVGNEYVTAEAIASAPRLRMICRFGVHVYRVDMDAARQRDIRVVNCPHAGSAAVVEYMIGGLLHVLRRMPLVNGARKEDLSTVIMESLVGKTLGVIGLGSIGTDLARKGVALSCRVLACNRSAKAPMAGVEMTDLDRLLSESDIVAVNVSAADDTFRLIDARRMRAMKAGAYLVNVAFPDAIDAGALHQALQDGHLAGAVLDFVYPGVSFRDLPQVFQTPHIAAKTWPACVAKANMVCRSFEELEAGGPLSFEVGGMPAHGTTPARLASSGGGRGGVD